MKIALYVYESFFSPQDIKKILQELLSHTKHESVDVFTDFPLELESQRIRIFYEKNPTFFKNTFGLHKFFLSQNYDCVLNFGKNFPLFYKKNCFYLIPSLEKIWYPDIENTTFLKKYGDILTQKMYLKNAKKILCFTQTCKEDLNEKLNIEENTIEVLPGFFSFKEEQKPLSLDIKNKHSLQNDYIIFDAGLGSAKNLSRLLQALKIYNKTHQISLLLLGKEIANDIATRQEVIQLGLEKECIFVGEILEKEAPNYYQQAVGVVYPGLYNHFPFELQSAVEYDAHIFASQHSEIQKVFGDKVEYFPALGVSQMVEILQNIPQKKAQPDYTSIQLDYSIANFTKNLMLILEKNI